MTQNPTTNTEAGAVADVAAKLTEAQKQAVLNPFWHGSGCTQFALVDCLETKLGPPMVHMFTFRWDRLTEFGLAVRQHLTENDRSGS